MGLDETEEFIARQRAQVIALFGVPPALIGPEPRRCPACGRTREACLYFYGRDPVHDSEIRAALPDLGISI